MSSEDNHCCHPLQAHHSEDFKKKIGSRLARIEGQVRGVNRLIQEDTWCDDVLNQITSIQSALTSVKTVLLEAHIKGCITRNVKDGNEESIDELMTTLKKMLK